MSDVSLLLWMSMMLSGVCWRAVRLKHQDPNSSQYSLIECSINQLVARQQIPANSQRGAQFDMFNIQLGSLIFQLILHLLLLLLQMTLSNSNSASLLFIENKWYTVCYLLPTAQMWIEIGKDVRTEAQTWTSSWKSSFILIPIKDMICLGSKGSDLSGKAANSFSLLSLHLSNAFGSVLVKST